MGASFYRNAECCVLVCDLTDAKSFETIDTWRQEFLTQLAPKDPDNFPFVLLGNKCDKEGDRKVAETKIKQYCDVKNHMPYFETSAKDNTNVDKAFEEIAAVSNGQRKERQVVDSTVMGRSFDEDTTARLKEILLPSKTRIPVDNAYGMFIGYTIGLDPNQYTNDQYRKAVQDKMVLDIQNHVQYIVDTIKEAILK